MDQTRGMGKFVPDLNRPEEEFTNLEWVNNRIREIRETLDQLGINEDNFLKGDDTGFESSEMAEMMREKLKQYIAAYERLTGKE